MTHMRAAADLRAARPWTAGLAAAAFSATLSAAPVSAQLPSDLANERATYRQWLTTAPLSPYAAIALQPIGSGVSIGSAPADIPLAGLDRATVTEARGLVTLTRNGERRILPRNRPVPLDSAYRIIVTGAPGRSVLAAYGDLRSAKPPEYFDYRAELALAVELAPPERRGRFRLLGPDGVETEGEEAGLVAVSLGDATTRLRVYRLGAEDDDEAELLIFFRDATNRDGSYPAGRFVELLPLGGRRYRIDFNRARNPFCAYNSVFPCPAPWPGNQLSAAVAAGERYAGGGLELE